MLCHNKSRGVKRDGERLLKRNFAEDVVSGCVGIL
jgi:hypothetical protein